MTTGLLTMPSSGDATSNITFGSYGNTGANPVINGSDFATTWTIANEPVDQNTSINAGNYNTIHQSTTYYGTAQSFTTTGSYTAINVTLSLAKAGAPTGSCWVEIYSDSSGVPGTVLTNGTSQSIDCSTLTTSFVHYTFTFAVGPSLTTGTLYHVRLNTNISVSSSNYIKWEQSYSNPYAGGHAEYSNSGGTWSSDSSGDQYFVISKATTNVWQAAITTQPHAVYFDGTYGTKETSIANLTALTQWYWASSVLYVYSTSNPLILYTAPGIEVAQRNFGIDYNSKQYITVQDFGITRSNKIGVQINGNNNTFQDSILSDFHTDNEDTSMFAGDLNGCPVTAGSAAGASNILITRLTVANAGWGIYFFSGAVGGGNSTISHNIVHDIRNDSISMDSNATGAISNLIVEHNEIYNGGLTVALAGGIAWSIENGGTYGTGNIMRYNKSHDNGNATYAADGYNVQTGAGNVAMYYNLAWNNSRSGFNFAASTGVTMYNNVVYNSGSVTAGIKADVIISDQAFVTLKNNIIISSTAPFAIQVTDVPSNYTSDYNVFNTGSFRYGSNTYNFANYKTNSLQDAHSVYVDPLFVSTATHDFHLQLSSPARDAGTNVSLTTDYEGSPVPSGLFPDIGAYEFQDSVAPTTTASPVEGIYNSTQSVTLSCNDGAGVGCDKTYYTTDGSTPTTSSSQYSIPLVISSTTTLKFFSRDRNENAETVKTKTYTVDMEAPAVTNNTAVKFHTDTTEVILSLATNENSTCRYSANQSDAYVDMTAFATTGTTAHSSIVSNLTHGTYAYYVICRDTFGNDTRYTLAFEIAQRENDTGISDAKLKTDGNNKALDEDTKLFLNQNESRLKGHNDDLANGTVKIYKGGKRYATVDVDSDGRWNGKLAFGHDKSYTLKLEFYDEYGTLRDEKKYDVDVDTEKPIFTSLFLPWRMTRTLTPLNWMATDNDKIDSYKISLEDQTHKTKTYKTKSPQFIIPEDVARGRYTLTVTAIDRAGNTAEESGSVWVR